MRLNFRILNVFTVAGEALTGNPLCVFEDGRGLDADTMQALALQFNLSETTFILPADQATAAVRIFTPTLELPFAGHPTLGTAHVVRDLMRTDSAITLSMSAGCVPVSFEGAVWTLRAAAPKWHACEASRVSALVAALGLAPAELAADPLWVSTGMEQLMVPLRTTQAVAAATAGAGLAEFANHSGKVGVYLFSPLEDAEMQVRFFFGKAGGAVIEDPATGSACANLGGFALATGAPLPLRRVLWQGRQVGRPSRLELTVDPAREILVGGEVIEIGRGVVTL